MSGVPPFGAYGKKKAALEAAGVKFSKVEGEAWVAEFEGQTIGSARLLIDCIDNAALALGGI